MSFKSFQKLNTTQILMDKTAINIVTDANIIFFVFHKIYEITCIGKATR